MERFANYVLFEKIHETRNSIIYRGHKENESQPFVIKVLKTSDPNPSEVARFKQEYNLVKKLNIEGVIKTIELVEYNDKYAIIEEDFGGVSLKDILKTKKLELKSFLQISSRVSETLGLIHKNNIIHLDIKPDNILINSDQSQVKISDFGISAVLTHANDELYNPEVIEGTLSYMSPEQTGRMNRSVDYRTDMYSLGVTFYEMLTGEVPFKSKDPMELIHSHIARQPAAPAALDSSIPPVLSTIILKLLSKNPEERYQNCLGLAADINECLNRLTQNGIIEEFTVATKDVSIRFNIPQSIVGREKEINALMESFDRVINGANEMILVQGQPGIGKSAVINEIQKPIVAKNGYFIFGKYDQFRKDVPYSAIIQSFQGLMRQIISESEERIQTWKGKILSVLGPNGKVIIDIIPELELIIGRQPEVSSLGPEASLNRFMLVFKNFVNVFTADGHPLAIFLDDLQWADLASLKLLENIITDNEIKYLFLVGAYRDNELTPVHPLAQALEVIRKKGGNLSSLTVGPLDIADINLIVMNVLLCKAEKSIPLAELINKKTGGNPFFVIQFLKNLYDNRIIELDPQSGWNWDMKRIKNMQVTDNVVDFLSKKITDLPEKTQHILQICACIGNRFDLETLSVVSGKSIDDTLADITSTVQEDMVSLHGNMYKFHHDRIQEAVYSLIPDEEKALMHYKIGNNVLKKTNQENMNEKIFYIVDQLNRGIRLVKDYKERINLMNLNLAAAAKAKKSTAYATAADYLETSKSLLTADEWSSMPAERFRVYNEHTESIFLSGNIEKAGKLCEDLFKIAATKLEKGSVYILKARILEFQGGKLDIIINEIRKGLQLFGLSLAEDRQEIDRMIQEGIRRMKEHLSKNPIEELVNLPQMNDAEKVMTMNLLFQATPAAIQSYPPLFVLIQLMMFDLAISYGTTAASSKNFIDCGMIQGSILGDYDAGYRLAEAAFALIDKYKSESLKAAVYFVFSTYISHWRVHYQESLDYYAMSQQTGLETGDIQHVAYSCAHRVLRLLYTGRSLDECKSEAEKAIAYLGKLHAVVQLVLTRIYLNTILKFQTLPDKKSYESIEQESGEILKTIKETKNSSQLCSFGMCNVMANYFLGNMEAAEEWCSFTEPYIRSGAGHFPMADHCLFQSLILSEKWKTAAEGERNKIMETLAMNLEKLKHWSEKCPTNFAHKYYLLCAEISVVKGESLDSITDLYKKAVDSIGKNDFIHMRALINELQGKYWFDKGHATIGKSFIQQSYHLYEQWGATAKVEYLEKKYPDIVSNGFRKKAGRDSTTDTATTSILTGTTGTQTLDLTTVIKTSQSLSCEIDLGSLLMNIMKLSIENAGAQHGYLILQNENDKRLYIEATGRVDETVDVLKSIPLEGNGSLSISIVNYVHKTGENIVLGNAVSDQRFINDPYVIKNHPKSILCAPIKYKGAMAGIIYLENNLTTDAFTPERLELLSIFSAQAAISIENSRLIAHRENEAKLQTEMNIASRIQSVLLPENPAIPGFEITAYIKPTDDVGGDYYDVINSGNYNWVIIGDVSGHGVPAGLIMMMVQTTIQALVRKYPEIKPADLLAIVNEAIKYNVGKMNEQKYMTITAFSFGKNGNAVYSGLHQDILVYRVSSGDVEAIPSTGIWLSSWEMNKKNINSDLRLDKGDTLLLYTDGITEAKDSKGDMFSEEKLVKIFKKSGKSKILDIKEKIFEELQGYNLDDDVTVVILRKK